MNDIDKLKKEIEEIRIKDENKSDLISVTAHQLRTSLSALKWILKMFTNKDFGDINEEQKEYIEKAISSNERAIALVNYLLAFNNSENLSMALDFKEIDITEVIEDVISLFYGELKNKNIKLNFSKLETSTPKIKGDREMIVVIMQNLIENAIKYSFENEEIEVSMQVDEESSGVLISIHNDGIGIQKEDQVKIFNKFFRAPNAIEKESIGSGLGLFTTKNIIEKHNGKIWFDSQKDKGTTFFVLLPLI